MQNNIAQTRHNHIIQQERRISSIEKHYDNVLNMPCATLNKLQEAAILWYVKKENAEKNSY